jgi:hypothetical protein
MSLPTFHKITDAIFHRMADAVYEEKQVGGAPSFCMTGE